MNASNNLIYANRELITSIPLNAVGTIMQLPIIAEDPAKLWISGNFPTCLLHGTWCTQMPPVATKFLVRVLYSHLGVRNVTCYGIRYVSASLEEVAVCLTKEGSSGIRSSKYVQAWQSIEEQRLGLSLHQLVNIDITLCIVE